HEQSKEKQGALSRCVGDLRRTAGLSTTLRSGRDDNSGGVREPVFPGRICGSADPSWKDRLSYSPRIVISTGAKRSGEIRGFLKPRPKPLRSRHQRLPKAPHLW